MGKILNKNSKIILVIISILFAFPSFIYMLANKTLLNFNGDLEYCFLLTHNISRFYQALVFFIIITAFVYIYFKILKNREKLFKTKEDIFKYILIISAIFIFVMPFWCSDVFYYMGIGRLFSKYHQNPYYTDMKAYVEQNNVDLKNDTLMQKGYKNYWSNTTVVYGAIWTIICGIVSFFSFGNLELGILIFKIINLFIHILNCYFLYKITKKKVFPLIYGLNPFILIEGIANVHNDIYVIFFMLVAVYMLKNRKNLILSLLFLSFATTIKYFSILLLPLFIIYHFKEKDWKIRLLKCIQYGIVFAIFAGLPYLLFIRDISVFNGISEQRNRIAKGIYLFISQYFRNIPLSVDTIKQVALAVFAIIYIKYCVQLLIKKEVEFSKEMKKLFIFIIAFLFLLITNFQPWYFMWLVPFMPWQKSENIKLIYQIQIMTLYANIVFLINSESYTNGIPFFAVFVVGILCCMLKNKKTKNIIIREK